MNGSDCDDEVNQNRSHSLIFISEDRDYISQMHDNVDSAWMDLWVVVVVVVFFCRLSVMRNVSLEKANCN